MSHLSYITLATLVMSFITLGTRALPFIFSKLLSKSELITRVGGKLPGCIMLILVIYELRDTPIREFPFGVPELLGVSLVVITYLWKRNSMLSIFLISILYIISVNAFM